MKKTKKPDNFFWKEPKNGGRIKIVNPHDFTEPRIVSCLRDSTTLPDSFGITDIREIKLRNEISDYLLNRQELAGKIIGWKQLAEKYKALPVEENDFLLIYKQERNPYWDLIREVISEFDRPDVPRRFRDFAELLKSSLPLEASESEMAKRISDKLENVTRMEGVAEIVPFSPQYNLVKFATGIKSYSAAWSSYEINYPKWTNALLARITGISKLAKYVIKENTRTKANRSAAIIDFPTSVFDDLTSGLKKILSLILPPQLSESKTKGQVAGKTKHDEQDERSRYDFYYNLTRDLNLIFTVTFKYSEHGLSFKVISVNRAENEDIDDFEFSNSDGCTSKEKEKIQKIQDLIRDKVKSLTRLTGVLETYEHLERYLGLFSKQFEIASRETDAAFKWYALSNLYENKDNIGVYQDLSRQRAEFSSIINQLRNLSYAIELFRTEAKKLNIPLCIPGIRDDGRIGVSFNDMAPINILGQNVKMIPFTMPIINGRMVCLTGRHGGGKSVAGKSVIENIYLAQSGLPVFAKNFSVDIKTVLGSVTNDTGEGSTATVFIEKVKNLFAEISKVPKEQSLIFIDEIGKGTQEIQGFNLGLNILTALKGQQFSVIFNTQIMRLAETAQNELGAICLKVDKNHTFSEGIGDGEMDQLVKESGLDKFFTKN